MLVRALRHRSLPSTLAYAPLRPLPRKPFSTSCPRARRPTPLSLPTLPADTTPPCTPFNNPPLERGLPSRRGLLLFYLPVPVTSWPSHLDTLSPLLAAATKALKPAGLGVNAIYDGEGSGKFPGLGEEECYPARMVYPDGRQFSFPAFSQETLKSVDFRKAVEYAPKADMTDPNVAEGRAQVLVCTHGSRDCRCADRGGPLVAALRDVVERKGAGVGVFEVAHVGGHKWAVNALLLPSLDMFSSLAATDAPALVDFIARGRPLSDPLWAHWRGRIGISEAEQAEVWQRVERGEVDDDAAGTGPGTSPGTGTGTGTGTAPTPDTVELVFRTFQGDIHRVRAPLGATLLTVGQAANLPALEGSCGGNCECATCHLYLEPVPTDAPVPEPSDEEEDMLGYAIGERESSRLGCQVKVTPELGRWVAEGGVIDLPRF